MTTEKPIEPLVDEYKLVLDESGEYKESILTQLENYRCEVKKKLDVGCTQDEYRQYASLICAIGEAKKVVERIWMLAREQTKFKEEGKLINAL